MKTIAIDVRRINAFGIGTYIRNVLRSLAQLDGDHRYLLLGPRAVLQRLDGYPGRFTLVPWEVPEASPQNWVLLPRLLHRRGADLLHVPHYHWIPPWLPCPHLVTVHDLVEFVFPQPARSRWRATLLRRAVRRSLHRAERVVAVSHATKRDIMRIFGLPAQQIEVIYNGVDDRLLTCHATAVEREMLASRYAIDYPFILYAGDVRPHKNVEKLIEAFALLKLELAKSGEFPELKLIIIGDEISRHPRLRRAVIRGRMENEVRFLGFVPVEVLRVFYDLAKVFAFPSRYEGFGLPPLEAMAQGTPVVTSNTTSLPEILGDAALLVNPENVFDIMHGLQRCLLDRETREELKVRGYRQAQRYSWALSAAQLRHLYDQAVAE